MRRLRVWAVFEIPDEIDKLLPEDPENLGLPSWTYTFYPSEYDGSEPPWEYKAAAQIHAHYLDDATTTD